MTDLVAAAFLLIGSFFMLLAGLGLVRFPDLYCRVQAVSKSSSFGAVFLALAVILHFRQFWVTFDGLVVIGFLYLTLPVSSHLIGRAGYCLGVKVWEGTVVDELEGRYDLRREYLDSGIPPDQRHSAPDERA